MGHEVRVITPDHGHPAAQQAGLPSVSATLNSFGSDETMEIVQASLAPDIPIHFVRNARYFGRPEVYGMPDDLLRYHFFSHAAFLAPKLLDWRPDIIHCNDWHTALIPFGLQNHAWNDAFYQGIASILTIHNLAYRGPDDLSDVLSQGIFYADAVSTVSQTYAREITTPEYGQGLERLLQLRHDRLYGIVNGLDVELYDPATDPSLVAHYDAEHPDGKAENKRALQQVVGLATNADRPLAGAVVRLEYQKGIDLLAQVMERAVTELGMQFVVLGTGDLTLQQQLQEATARHPDAAKVVIGFNLKLAQQIYGGADLFLMPSRFEPCGLGQLIAMRYGTVPVVRRTGGLADTVQHVSDDLGSGTGFVFEHYTPEGLYWALGRAAESFHQREAWAELRRRCMVQDYSWDVSARQYGQMYREVLGDKG